MDLDKREFYYEKFKNAMWDGFTPDDYIEYYDYIKERFDVDIDFFENAPDDLVVSAENDEDRIEHLEEALRTKNRGDIEQITEENKRWRGKKFPRPNLKPGALEPLFRDKVPEHFCIYPFTQMNIDPDGRVRPCCKWEVGNVWDYNNGSLEDKNIQELFDQPYIEAIKKEFLRGGKPKACKACWDEEAAGLQSIRNMYQWGGKSMPSATWFLHITSPQPIGLDLKLSSICNNKCRICSPFLSSKWLQEYEDLGLVSGDVLNGFRLNAKEKFMTNPENVEILKHWAINIQTIQFFGGEPLLQADHNLILKTIAETGHAGNITLYYNTNGSIYDEEICKNWESFGEVSLNYSIDDIGKRFDYERHPVKYEDVMDNVRKYYDYVFPDDKMRYNIITDKKYFSRFFYGRDDSMVSAEKMKQRGMKISMIHRFYITVSIFNMFYLDDILRELTSRWNIELQFNLVHFPHYYAIHILPVKLKDAIKEKLTEPTFVKEMNNKYIKCDASITGNVNDEIDNLITFMYSIPENPELIKEAFRYIKIHDNYREESFAEVFPEIYEFLEEYE
jgi:MoaA/NifB/PqqE/SkfB family radical SAM enzyme